jgi:hypothetical protein
MTSCRLPGFLHGLGDGMISMMKMTRIEMTQEMMQKGKVVMNQTLSNKKRASSKQTFRQNHFSLDPLLLAASSAQEDADTGGS